MLHLLEILAKSDSLFPAPDRAWYSSLSQLVPVIRTEVEFAKWLTIHDAHLTVQQQHTASVTHPLLMWQPVRLGAACVVSRKYAEQQYLQAAVAAPLPMSPPQVTTRLQPASTPNQLVASPQSRGRPSIIATFPSLSRRPSFHDGLAGVLSNDEVDDDELTGEMTAKEHVDSSEDEQEEVQVIAKSPNHTANRASIELMSKLGLSVDDCVSVDEPPLTILESVDEGVAPSITVDDEPWMFPRQPSTMQSPPPAKRSPSMSQSPSLGRSPSSHRGSLRSRRTATLDKTDTALIDRAFNEAGAAPDFTARRSTVKKMAKFLRQAPSFIAEAESAQSPGRVLGLHELDEAISSIRSMRNFDEDLDDVHHKVQTVVEATTPRASQTIANMLARAPTIAKEKQEHYRRQSTLVTDDFVLPASNRLLTADSDEEDNAETSAQHHTMQQQPPVATTVAPAPGPSADLDPVPVSNLPVDHDLISRALALNSRASGSASGLFNVDAEPANTITTDSGSNHRARLTSRRSRIGEMMSEADQLQQPHLASYKALKIVLPNNNSSDDVQQASVPATDSSVGTVTRTDDAASSSASAPADSLNKEDLQTFLATMNRSELQAFFKKEPTSVYQTTSPPADKPVSKLLRSAGSSSAQLLSPTAGSPSMEDLLSVRSRDMLQPIVPEGVIATDDSDGEEDKTLARFHARQQSYAMYDDED